MTVWKEKQAAKYKDPRWQKRRLEILERDDWACQKCFDPDSTLHVHHRYYEKDKEPWEYPDDALITLCEDCHEGEKGFKDELKAIESVVREWCFTSDIIPLWEVISSFKDKGTYPAEVILDALRHFFVLGDGLETVTSLYWEKLKERRLKRSGTDSLHKT